MKTKVFIISFLFISASYAEVCDENLFQDLKDIATPNCIQNQYIYSAANGNTESLCKKCKKEFETKSASNIPSLAKKNRDEIYKAALSEYKKNTLNNLISIIKLRTTNSTNSRFEKSIQACKMPDEKMLSKSCKSESARSYIEKTNYFQNLSDEAANEIAKIISPKDSFDPGATLSNRPKNACFIQEQKIIDAIASTLESSFEPDFIRAMKKLKASDFKGSEELELIMQDELYRGNWTELRELVSSHPLLGQKFKDPKSLIAFFSSVPSPEDSYSFKKALYSEENGNIFDSELAEACNKSFNSLIDTICDDAKTDSTDVDPFKNLDKLSDENFSSSSEFTSNQQLYEKNVRLLKYCDPLNRKGSINLSDKLSQISDNLKDHFRPMTLNQFKTEKYQTEIGNFNNFICSEQNAKACQNDDSLQCQVLKRVREPNKYVSPLETKIASSSNHEINSLLRSMIGKPTKLKPETVSTLTESGILQKADGTIVAQPDIPERRPAQYASAVQKIHASSPSRTTSVTSSRPQTEHQDETSHQENRLANSDASNFYGSSASMSESSSNRIDALDRQRRQLEDVQKEIERRLTGLPNKKPASLTEAKKIVSDSYQAKGRPYTPEQVNSLAETIMFQPAPSQAQASSTPSFGSETSQSNVSQGETLSEKFKKEQANKALMGMAGARNSQLNDLNTASSSGAAQAANKELAKVALSIAEDPKVSLSDVFTKKLDLNDPETKTLKDLLKKQNNFLLQLKSLNFKVVFNEKNGFNLLLESGDKREAERVRPQLEMFLNKLKRNNTLHNLSQSWST